MHANSLSAYDAITNRLPDSRAAVFRVIAQQKGISRQRIAEVLERPINEVTGRVKELLTDGLVIESGEEKTESGRTRALLEVAAPKCPF